MEIDYLEFDIDSNGKGVLYVVFFDGSYYDFLCCGVFNNNGLRLDLEKSQILGCMSSDGVDLDFDLTRVTTARKIIEDFWLIKPIKTAIKKAYQEALKYANDEVFYMPTGLSFEEKRAFIKKSAKT